MKAIEAVGMKLIVSEGKGVSQGLEHEVYCVRRVLWTYNRGYLRVVEAMQRLKRMSIRILCTPLCTEVCIEEDLEDVTGVLETVDKLCLRAMVHRVSQRMWTGCIK